MVKRFLLASLLLWAGGAMALLGLIAGRSGDGGVGLFTLAGMMLASLCGALRHRSGCRLWRTIPLNACAPLAGG